MPAERIAWKTHMMRRPAPADVRSERAQKPASRSPRMSPSQRRDLLLDAAINIFGRDGIGFARHAGIAKQAGVALATVFHYFPTREKLVEDVLAAVRRFFIEDVLDPPLAVASDTPETLLAILMRFCDSIDSHPAHAQIWLEWSTVVRAEIWASYLDFYEELTSSICEVVRRGIDAGTFRKELRPMDAARVTVGLAHLVAHLKFSGKARADIEQTMTSLVAGYLRPPVP
ncbi:TetR/AcrR family transcriptional regulator [Sphingobium herbicidovorans]